MIEMEITLSPIPGRKDLFILSIYMDKKPLGKVHGSYNDVCGAQINLDELHRIIPADLSSRAVLISKGLINKYVEEHPEIYRQG